MTITLDIRPEVQAELSRQAAAHGMDVNTYATSVLEEAAHVPTRSTRLSQDRLREALREMSQFSYKIPSLPDEAFSRESLYQDYD